MVIQGVAVINLIIALIGIMVCSLSLIMILFGIMKDKKTNTTMFCLFIGLLIYNFCLLFLQLTQGQMGKMWRNGVIVAGFGIYLYSALSAFIVTNYVLYVVDISKKRKRRILNVLLLLLISYIVTMAIEQLYGNLIWIDDRGFYRTGEASYIGYVMVAAYIFFDIYLLLRHGKKMSREQKVVFIVYLGIPFLALLAKAVNADVYLATMGTNISILIMLILAVKYQTENYRRQELANEQLKIDILLSQIQPHFLFNVLYVIQEICYINPEKASVAIGDFSMYLRHNMDSISISTPIPFEEELKHVQHYVALQQLRFGDALDVRYDLRCRDFTMPTLTLQPIVENAVRYGVRMAPRGRGTVVVRTSEHPDCYEVDVIDNGPGFEEGKLPVDGMSHKGISNVRERLRHISGGELIVASEPGKGTTVTMILPKE